MDRDELQERIRARRSGGEPYRRGVGGEESPGYQRFEPEPTDAHARRADRSGDRRHDYFREATPPPAAAAAASESPPTERDRPADLTRDPDDWTAPTAGAAAVVPPPPRVEQPQPEPESRWDAPTRYDELDDDGYAYEPADDDEYDTWEDDRERRPSGAGAFAILGFLALGVLALLGGAFLAGVFDDAQPGVGSASPTASIVASQAPVVSAPPSVAAASAVPSVPASAAPVESGGPVVFPDGFTAEAQACIPGSVDADGCDNSGAVNNGQVEIWVGFQNGTAADVVGADLIGPEGTSIGSQSIDLADIRCTSQCDGYTYFNFSNLQPGTYEVRITRNGDFAGSTTFEVT